MQNFACDDYIFPTTRANKGKQWALNSAFTSHVCYFKLTINYSVYTQIYMAFKSLVNRAPVGFHGYGHILLNISEGIGHHFLFYFTFFILAHICNFYYLYIFVSLETASMHYYTHQSSPANMPHILSARALKFLPFLEGMVRTVI